MASIERRIGKNGKPEYRARWRDAEGRSRRSKWLPRKHDAETAAALVVADLKRDVYIDHANPITVAEYARQWVSARPHRPTTKEWYDSVLRNHVEGTPLGARPLVKVRPSEVQAWATGRAQILEPYPLRVRVGVVRSIFGAAVQDGLLARNPVHRGLALPKNDHQPVIPLTVEQVKSLAAEMVGPYQAMVVAQAGLGLRMGELLALRVEDVNFLRRTVHIEWQLEQKTLRRVPPKTPKSRRDIPLPQVVAEALAQHMAAYPPAADGSLFTKYEGTGGRPRPSDVPPDRVSHQQYGSHLRRAAQRAGLPPSKTHDLRHHYASVLLHAGESVHAVAERLGHTDATMVLKVYGHLMPDTEDRTRRAVDAAWSEPAAAETGAI